MPINSNPVADVARSSQLSRRSAKRAQRAERQESRRAQTPKPEAAPSPTTNEAVKVSLSQSAQAQAQSAAAKDQASAPAPTPPSRNFIGSLAGAKVVNIGVQGGRSGNPVSIFASGEGPKAKKVTEDASQNSSTENSQGKATLDTEA